MRQTAGLGIGDVGDTARGLSAFLPKNAATGWQARYWHLRWFLRSWLPGVHNTVHVVKGYPVPFLYHANQNPHRGIPRPARAVVGGFPFPEGSCSDPPFARSPVLL